MFAQDLADRRRIAGQALLTRPWHAAFSASATSASAVSGFSLAGLPPTVHRRELAEDLARLIIEQMGNFHGGSLRRPLSGCFIASIASSGRCVE